MPCGARQDFGRSQPGLETHGHNNGHTIQHCGGNTWRIIRSNGFLRTIGCQQGATSSLVGEIVAVKERIGKDIPVEELQRRLFLYV